MIIMAYRRHLWSRITADQRPSRLLTPRRKAVLPRNAFGDSSPFNGGDAIWFNHPAPPPIGYDCTSGFPVRDGNVNAVVTAGHCYPSGGVGNTTYTNAASHHEIGVVNANLYMSE